MRKQKLKQLFLITGFVMLCFHLAAQEKSTSKINVAFDLYNRYVWRGLDYGKAPSIQPTFSYLKGSFEIGCWGSINTLGTYSEIDLYAKYTLKSFTIGVTDYFIHNEASPNNTHYLNYDGKSTTHAIEPSLQFKGPEKFPISVFAAAFVYGNDRAWGYDAAKDSTLENYYSSYFELGYTVKCHNKSFDLFMGLTPQAGAYGNTFGVVNAGISSSKTIEITDKFAIPVKASVIVNPQASNLFFLIGITI